MTDRPLAGFDFSTFTHDARTHDVYRAGSGPAVIVIHMSSWHPSGNGRVRPATYRRRLHGGCRPVRTLPEPSPFEASVDRAGNPFGIPLARPFRADRRPR